MALGRITALKQGGSSNCDDPVLQFINVSNKKEKEGFTPDVNALEFLVLDPDGAALYPTPGDPSAFQAIDVNTDCPTGGRLGDGRYVADYTVGANDAPGTYTIRWRVEEEAGDALRTYDQKFYVVSTCEEIPNAYVLLSHARAEGVPGGINDVRLRRSLELASDYVEEVTHRRFYPHFQEATVDGEGGPILQLDQPVIALSKLDFTFTTFTPADLPIQQGNIRVYNRHIRLDLTSPDDRQDPRIEFLRTGITRFPNSEEVRYADLLSVGVGFTQSQQNIKATGMFGYTDPDGSPMGKTPELLKEAVMRVAFIRYLRPLFNRVDGVGAAGLVVKEKTMDQQVEFADPNKNMALQGAFTGDSETDLILANYMRPPAFRSA